MLKKRKCFRRRIFQKLLTWHRFNFLIGLENKKNNLSLQTIFSVNGQRIASKIFLIFIKPLALWSHWSSSFKASVRPENCGDTDQSHFFGSVNVNGLPSGQDWLFGWIKMLWEIWNDKKYAFLVVRKHWIIQVKAVFLPKPQNMYILPWNSLQRKFLQFYSLRYK